MQKQLEFTCKKCGSHELIVTHAWSVLTGPESEHWQEWGPLAADHRWHYTDQEQREKAEDQDRETERGDFGELAEDDSASEPEAYQPLEREADPESDEFYVNCAGCDREIEFGWSQPERGGRIFPVESSDFVPGDCWPEPRYWAAWQQRHWLQGETDQP